jgi:hypothetical protein
MPCCKSQKKCVAMDGHTSEERKKEKTNGKGTEVAANKATVMKQYRLVLCVCTCMSHSNFWKPETFIK